jgi:DNA-damage-inducible protein J
MKAFDTVFTLYILAYMTTLSIRIDEKTKSHAFKVLKSIGLDMSSAVKVFLTQVIIEKGLPFTPTRSPKEIRAKWDREVARAMKSGKSFKTGREAIEDLIK